jgi:GNAT superfamily N-acetyltransferase
MRSGVFYSAIIEDVVVDPIFQGRGIGKMMMKYALDLASQEGCFKAVLSSNLKRHRSHAFYESLGFATDTAFA